MTYIQKTSGSKNREVGVRFSHKSIGDGRKDNIPDGSRARAGDGDSSVVVLVDAVASGGGVAVLLRSEHPNCKCSGEFGGRRCSSSTEAFPARSRIIMGIQIIIEGFAVPLQSSIVWQAFIQRCWCWVYTYDKYIVWTRRKSWLRFLLN